MAKPLQEPNGHELAYPFGDVEAVCVSPGLKLASYESNSDWTCSSKMEMPNFGLLIRRLADLRLECYHW